MWHKYYQRAESHFAKSNTKLALQHCQRALVEAQAAGTIEQLAMTLSLLTLLYYETKNALTVDTALQSVNAAGMAYGTDSIEWAEELHMLGEAYYNKDELNSSIEAQRKALSVFEQKAPPERYLEYADDLVELYTEVGRFADAEVIFLKALNVRKRLYGPLSRAVFAQVPPYTELLKAQGKTVEERRIDSLLDMCASCGWSSSHMEHAPEVEKVLDSVREAAFLGNQADILAVNRAAIEKLKFVVIQQQRSVPEDHVFRELKIHDYATPLYWLRRRFATLLREQAIEWNNVGTPGLLSEAGEVLRENLKMYPNHCDEFHLMCVLLQSATHNREAYKELFALTKASTNLTASAFTRALAMYRREGATMETTTAMRDADITNPHVLAALSASHAEMVEEHQGMSLPPLDIDPAQAYDLIVDWPLESAEEASHYWLYAHQDWLATEGAINYLWECVKEDGNTPYPRDEDDDGNTPWEPMEVLPDPAAACTTGDGDGRELWPTQWELG